MHLCMCVHNHTSKSTAIAILLATCCDYHEVSTAWEEYPVVRELMGGGIPEKHRGERCSWPLGFYIGSWSVKTNLCPALQGLLLFYVHM